MYASLASPNLPRQPGHLLQEESARTRLCGAFDSGEDFEMASNLIHGSSVRMGIIKEKKNDKKIRIIQAIPPPLISGGIADLCEMEFHVEIPQNKTKQNKRKTSVY